MSCLEPYIQDIYHQNHTLGRKSETAFHWESHIRCSCSGFNEPSHVPTVVTRTSDALAPAHRNSHLTVLMLLSYGQSYSVGTSHLQARIVYRHGGRVWGGATEGNVSTTKCDSLTEGEGV